MLCEVWITTTDGRDKFLVGALTEVQATTLVENLSAEGMDAWIS